MSQQNKDNQNPFIRLLTSAISLPQSLMGARTGGNATTQLSETQQQDVEEELAKLGQTEQELADINKLIKAHLQYIDDARAHVQDTSWLDNQFVGAGEGSPNEKVINPLPPKQPGVEADKTNKQTKSKSNLNL